MRYTKKLPRKPVEDVLFLVVNAQDILLRLPHEKAYTANESDLALLEKIAHQSDRVRVIALQTVLNLRQRLEGSPETPLLVEL